MKKSLILRVLSGALFSSAIVSTRGAGFDLPDQDAFAVGRGMAFAATADNPSAIYYNPAGISQLHGNNFRAGLYNIYLDPSYKNPATGKMYDNQDTLHSIPQLFFTHGWENCPVSFGFGIYSPFGLGVHWPQSTGFRTTALRATVTDIAINPVVSFKLGESFSIGGGVMANYTDADLRQGILGETPGADNYRFHGNGWDFAGNVGALWRPIEQISIGASFRSEMNPELHGHSTASGVGPLSGRASAHTSLPLPFNVIGGISYRPTANWNLEFDADYTDWDAERNLVIHQSSSLLGTPVVAQALDWQSSWYYEWGATRYLNNGWHVSAGYIFNENSVPDKHYTPVVADLDRHFLSIGLGRKGKRIDFDVAYQFGYGPTRTVTGATGASASANGQYTFISHAVSISGEIHF